MIARQVTGRGPPLWGILGVGALLVVGTGELGVEGVVAAVAAAAPVVLFLLALFLFAAALRDAGALDHLAQWLVARARSPTDLPMVLFVGFGAASAFLVNDALVLIGAPVLLGVAVRLKVPPAPLLWTLAFAVTVGSVLTPFGNPQNLLVASQSGIVDPVGTFLRYLLVPTAINLAIGAIYLRRVFRSHLVPVGARAPVRQGPTPRLVPAGNWYRRVHRAPVLAIFPVTLAGLVVLGVAGSLVRALAAPPWAIAAVGATVLMAVTPGRGRIVRGVDGPILLVFLALFVVVAGAGAGGALSVAAHALPTFSPGRAVGTLGEIAGTALVGSQLVSNVPWVAVQLPILRADGFGPTPTAPWLALAGASTLAGNVTLLGAASNLIVGRIAERAGVPFRLGPFVRYGLPLATVSTAVLVACLAVGL